jgi:hypothetical protein
MDSIRTVVMVLVWMCFNLHGSWIDGEHSIALTCAGAVKIGSSSSTRFAVVNPFCMAAAVLEYERCWRLGKTNPLVKVWSIM